MLYRNRTVQHHNKYWKHKLIISMFSQTNLVTVKLCCLYLDQVGTYLLQEINES